MSSKKIEIQIAATGGDQAAAQFGRVSKAGAGLGKELSEQFTTARQKADELTNALNDTGSSLDQNVSAIDMRTRAQAVAEIAQALGKVGEFAKSAANQVREASPEMADALDNVSLNIDRVTSSANMAAQGMAAGGPMGAAIGALVGAALPDLKIALDGVISSQANLAEAERAGAQLKERLREEVENGTEAYRAAIDAVESYKEKTDDLNRSLDLQIQSLRDRNAIMDATAKGDAAERDAVDAERIRKGDAPEDVKADRAKFDAQQKLAAIARKEEEVMALEDAARTKLADKQSAVTVLENDPRRSDPKQVEQTEKELQKARNELETAKREFQDSTYRTSAVFGVTQQERRTVNQETKNRVSGFQDAKSQRLAREKEREDEEAAREADKRMREEQREMEKARRDEGKMNRGSGRRGAGGGYGGGYGGGGYGGGFDFDYDVQRLPGLGPSGRPRLSAIEDGHNRAEDRQSDRDDRAAERQADREARGGRKPGSLELLESRAGAAMNGQRDQGSDQGGGQERMLSLIETLLAHAESGKGSGASESKAIWKQLDILERRIRNLPIPGS